MLGLTEEELPKECQIDIQEDTRDICRNPMQWNRNQAQNYGFSDCDPVEDNQGWDNVHPQKMPKRLIFAGSTLSPGKRLLAVPCRSTALGCRHPPRDNLMSMTK